MSRISQKNSTLIHAVQTSETFPEEMVLMGTQIVRVEFSVKLTFCSFFRLAGNHCLNFSWRF